MRMDFVITVEYPTVLEPMVVRNYVNMALKKYQKLCTQTNSADYFGGVYNSVKFRITEIPQVDRTDLRKVVEQIKTIDGHFEEVERHIG